MGHLDPNTWNPSMVFFGAEMDCISTIQYQKVTKSVILFELLYICHSLSSLRVRRRLLHWVVLAVGLLVHQARLQQ